MPEPEYEPEQQLGPRIADAFQTKADAAAGDLWKGGLAAEARRRVRKRRQALIAGSAAVVVAVAIGGVWGAVGSPNPVATSAGDSNSAGAGSKEAAPETDTVCPDRHPILEPNSYTAPAVGLDLATPVYGLQACRYRLTPGATMLLGSGTFNATTAQRIVDEIKVLPERNPDLPVFKCRPEQAHPSEAIVLRFDTAHGPREVWVHYDGCADAGFFTGTRTYGLYAAPLKLFMTGSLRPAGGTYLDHLKGW